MVLLMAIARRLWECKSATTTAQKLLSNYCILAASFGEHQLAYGNIVSCYVHIDLL